MTYIARVSLLVVRHAHAGKRSAWPGDDRLRPLSEKGQKQALGIADVLVLHHPEHILSSPAVRCTTTVAPLAEQVGVEVENDERLFEGVPDDQLLALLREVGPGTTVLCTHGDVIPRVLDRLVEEGMEPRDAIRCQKASTWVVERTASGWGTGTYLAPPG